MSIAGSIGQMLRRGDEGYEAARQAAVWNGRTPDRFPDIIVQAASDADVLEAVRLARREGWRIGIRSGGHSWAASFLRDGGMLLDLSRMDGVQVDAGSSTARVQPGTKGTNLNRALKAHDLFFPTGHCMTVGIGGFLLQGGFGWNSRLWGPACASVLAIELVTAEGELVYADETRNSDLFWAARGAGPGFFGVVTCFHLKLFPRPNVFMTSLCIYPIHLLDEVLSWAREIAPTLSRRMEAMVFVRRGLLGHAEPTIAVIGPTLADTEAEARAALALLDTCPVRDQALVRDLNVVTEYELLMQETENFYPEGHRYAADNMWTDAPAEALLPAMRDIARTIPGSPTHMMWLLWGPPEAMPDMAFSMEAGLYIALYAAWQDSAEDARHIAWVTDQMRGLEPLSKGIQLADENLGNRPFRFMADGNLRRLQAIRATRDPQGLFHGWMGLAAGSPDSRQTS